MKGQTWPIKSKIKSKRIKWQYPLDQTSWAFMKETREFNKTKKIFDVDPYVEVYQYRDNLYALFSENADGMGDPWMYLIIGPEKAMLIDTSFGIGDLKGLVNEITGGMPLIVVNTHPHPDHSYGNCQFDKVYCHEYAVDFLKEQFTPHLLDYLMDENGNCIWMEFDQADIIPYKEYEIVGVPDGYIFNLGGDYEIELVWTAGHHPAHAMYIDKINRILFAGDDICSMEAGIGTVSESRPMAFGEFATVTAFRDNLAKIVKRIDEIDYIFPAHFILNIESNLLFNIMEALDAIIANPEAYEYKEERMVRTGGKVVFGQKFIKGFGTLKYTLEEVAKP